MKRSDVLKGLQTHKRYSKMTQKDIAEKLGGITNLRTELSRLENKHSKKSQVKINLESINNDVKTEILLKMTYQDIKNICSTNKEFNQLCQNDFWNKLLLRDFPFYHQDKEAKKAYQDWYNFFDYQTLKIISLFIINRIKYNNLQIVYDDIFKLLVNYILINNEIIQLPTKDEMIIKDDLEMNKLTHRIFDYLNVKISQEKYMSLSKIIYLMRMSMEDGKIPRF